MDLSVKPREQTPGVNADSNFFVTEPFHTAPDEVAPAPAHRPAEVASGRRLWLDRIWVVLYVAFCIEVGILLAVLPWYGRIWTDNSFMIAHPMLRAFVAENFVRGLVTGLGLVDIWLGIWEAAHYREPKPTPPPPPAAS